MKRVSRERASERRSREGSAPSLARSREAHFAYPNRRACSQASGLVIEHESTGDEERLVKNLAIKNYKAAAVGVTKLSPLHDKVFEEIGKE